MRISYAGGSAYLDHKGAGQFFIRSDNVAGSTALAGLSSTGFLLLVPIGYTTGVGGAATQATNKSTGVTINKPTGVITMNGAAGGGGHRLLRRDVFRRGRR